MERPESAETTIETIDIGPLCSRVKARLLLLLGAEVYSSWFNRLELEYVGDGIASLSIPTLFLKRWILDHYRDDLRAALCTEDPSIRNMVLRVRSLAPYETSSSKNAPVLSSCAPLQPDPDTRPPWPPLDVEALKYLKGATLSPSYTLSAFARGPTNSLAFAAAQQFVECLVGRPPTERVLYMYGETGVGKSHLLQAIAHAGMSDDSRRVLYLSCEKFMESFAHAVTTGRRLAFKTALRSVDILLLDDVQLLSGRPAKEEFWYSISALVDRGYQVVISSDRQPDELEGFDQRCINRLKSGLVIPVGTLTEEMRLTILQLRVEAARKLEPDFDVSPEILAHLACIITGNGRQLDGAVNSLRAWCYAHPEALTIATVEHVVKIFLARAGPKHIRIEDIQRIVRRHYNLRRDAMTCSQRTRDIVRPRQVAMYLSKELTLRSLPEIGRRFGGRDHTRVMHAIQKIENLVSRDPQFAEEVEHLRRLIL